MGKLVVFLNWKNGKKTKHNTDVIYRRCPQKVGFEDTGYRAGRWVADGVF